MLSGWFGGSSSSSDAAEPAGRVEGRSTASVVQLDAVARTLNSATVGDSGWWVLRQDERERLRIAHRSEQQQHVFNCPYQLGTLDGIELNTPSDAGVVHDVSLQLGDVIVLATDGCFDALHPLEILELVAGGLRDGASAQRLADLLVDSAVAFSKDPMRLSPVVLAMQREGLVARGREAQDDVTVVVALLGLAWPEAREPWA